MQDIINNNFTSIIVNFNFNVFVNLFTYAAATTTGIVIANKLVSTIINFLIDIIQTKWRDHYQDKKVLALEITKVINEGTINGWNSKPRDMEHIQFLSRLLENKDKRASSFFSLMISSWSISAILQQNNSPSTEDIEFCLTLQHEAQKASEDTSAIINTWL